MNNKQLYMGVDLGTSSLKIIIVDGNGQQIYEKKETYLNYLDGLKSEQNPLDWKVALFESIKSIPNDLKRKIKSIGLAGQMHGLVLLDKQGIVLRPAILWNDQRTIKEVEFLNNQIGKERIYKYTNNIALTGFTAPKVLWVKQNEPDIFSKIGKILLPKDYLCYVLTNEFATDYSDASGTLYFDVKDKKWSEPMLEILGLKEVQLPKLYASTAYIANISNAVSSELGLSLDVKVYIGGGDQAMGALGSLVIDDYETSISIGTSGVILVNFNHFAEDKTQSLHVFCNALSGYYFMGVMLSCAQNFKWWSKINKQDIDQLLIETKRQKNNLIFLPYLQGERTPINDPLATGAIFGLTSNHTDEDITIAIMEGTALGLKDIFESIKHSGIKVTKAQINGGGTLSQTFVQMIADALGIDLIISNIKNTVAFGAALTGIINDYGLDYLSNIKKNCSTDKIVQHDEQWHAYYEEKYCTFKQIYEVTKSLNK